MWKYVSKEKGTHKRPSANAPWKWSTLEHQEVYLTGTTIAASIECIGLTYTETIGDYYALMNLNYVIKVTPLIEGCPFSMNTDYNTSKIFHVDD